MEIINNRTIQSRKEHLCSFCGLKIPKGSDYVRTAITDSGTVWTWKSHITCDELVNKLNMHEDDCGDGLDSQGFHNYIWEFVRENYPFYSENKENISWTEAIEFTKEQLRIQD